MTLAGRRAGMGSGARSAAGLGALCLHGQRISRFQIDDLAGAVPGLSS